MNAQSIDFDQIQLSQEAIQEVHLSYANYKSWIPGQLNYLKVQKLIESNGWQADFLAAVEQIKSKYDTSRSRIPFEFFSGNYEHGTEWIARALKKQLYYFLSHTKRPQDYQYRIANPLNDQVLQQEIIDRALGWDYWCNDFHGDPVHWRYDAMINDLLTKHKYKSSFPFPADYPLKDGQLAAWALALLGKRMRELA